MRIFVYLVLASICAVAVSVQAEDGDAWPLYDKAAQRIREGDKLGKSCPAASNFLSTNYPPFSELWEKTAKDAYDFNASAFEAVHQAAALKTARWPVIHEGKDVKLAYLSEVRNIANEVGDAAMYDHVHGNDAAALQRIRDLLHLTDLLDQAKDELVIQSLVAVGIRMLAFHRLEVIATEIHLSHEPQNDDKQLVPVESVRSLIKQLLTLEDPATRITDMIDHENALGKPYEITPDSLEKVKLTLRRGQMEQNLAAMSLACQVFRFEKGHWAASLEELTAELPAPPADNWGPMGYALIKNGRPDGSHRPLVYSRCGAADGGPFFYPTGGPQFGFYNSSTLGIKSAITSGQFRDVSLWDGGNRPPGMKQLP